MVRKIFLWIVILTLLVIPLVVAEFKYEVGVNVDTDTPDRQIVVRFRDVDTGKYFQTVNGETDGSGRFNYILGTDREELKVVVYWIQNISEFVKPENIISMEEAGPFITGETIFATVTEVEEPEVVETPISANITEQNLTGEVNESEELIETETSVTGFTLFGDSNTSTIILYILGGILLVVIIFFIVRIIIRRRGERVLPEIKVRKLSEWKASMSAHDNKSRAIEEAERKLQEAQAEINRLKNQDKIRSAERKLKEDQEAIERMKRGE